LSRRNWVIGAVFVLVVVGAVVLRVCFEGRAELDAAVASRDAGDLAAARTHFLCAARWYLPLSSTSRDGVVGLLDLGDHFLANGDPKEAVFSFDDARGALHSTAWLLPPDMQLLDRADQGYADALAAWKKQLSPSADQDAARQRYLDLARSVDNPNRWWMFVMGASFIAWIASLAVAAWRWDQGRSARIRPLVAAAASLIVWIVSLVLI